MRCLLVPGKAKVTADFTAHRGVRKPPDEVIYYIMILNFTNTVQKDALYASVSLAHVKFQTPQIHISVLKNNASYLFALFETYAELLAVVHSSLHTFPLRWREYQTSAPRGLPVITRNMTACNITASACQAACSGGVSKWRHRADIHGRMKAVYGDECLGPQYCATLSWTAARGSPLVKCLVLQAQPQL